jgi:hypothetical protein
MMHDHIRAVFAGREFKAVCADFGILAQEIGRKAGLDKQTVSRIVTTSHQVRHGAYIDLIFSLPDNARREYLSRVFKVDIAERAYIQIVKDGIGYRGYSSLLPDFVATGVTAVEVFDLVDRQIQARGLAGDDVSGDRLSSIFA